MVGKKSAVSRGALACAAVVGIAITSVGGAHANAIYDATGGAEMGGDVIDPNAPGGVGVGPVVADRFFTFSSIPITLTSVTLNLKLNGAPLSGFTIDLWNDSTTTPGLPVFSTEQLIASVKDSSLTSNFALYTFTPTSPITLAANTFYDIGIDTVAGDSQVTNVIFGNTVDPAVLGRAPVIVGALYFHTVGGVDPNSDGPYELIVNVLGNVAVPEASTWTMMFAGFAGIGYLGYRRARPTASVA